MDLDVCIHQCNLGYEDIIDNELKSRGYRSILLSREEIFQAFKNNFSSDFDKKINCFVINGTDNFVVDQILDYILSSKLDIRKFPRLILMSSILTWAGRKYHVPINGNINEFLSRVPLPNEGLLYKLENKFYSCSLLYRGKLCCISVGVIYGGKGFDFEDILKSIWNTNKLNEVVLFSTCGGSNKVPMIHIQDYVSLVLKIATNDSLSHFFVPAVDGNAKSMKTVMQMFCRPTNRYVRFIDQETAVQQLMKNPRDVKELAKWSVDISFTDAVLCLAPGPGEGGGQVSTHDPLTNSGEKVDKAGSVNAKSTSLAIPHLADSKVSWREFTCGMSEMPSHVWGEFQTLSVEPACTLLVVGPPSSMKTELAKRLCDRLHLQYITVPNCIEYILRASTAKTSLESELNIASADQSAETLNLAAIEDPLESLQVELKRSIEIVLSSMQSSKSKGKGAPESVDLATLELKSEIIEAIPKELIFRCVQARLKEDATCERVGYTLDVWGGAGQGGGKCAVSSYRDMYDLIYPASSNALVNEEASIKNEISVDNGSLSARSALSEMSGVRFVSDAERKPQLIIELSNAEEACCSRYLKSVGMDGNGKISKEHQAIVKQVETSVKEYNGLLKQVPLTEGDSIPPLTPLLSHPAVIEMENAKYKVLRIDFTRVLVPGDVNDKIDLICEFYSSRCQGGGGGGVRGSNTGEPADVSGNVSAPPDADTGEKNALNDVVLHSPVSASSEANAKVEDSSASINANLSHVNEALKTLIYEHNNQMQAFLMDNVLPHVAEGLIKIRREEVEDPLMYLIEFLHDRAMEIQQQETNMVYEKFLVALKTAEEQEAEAARQLQAAALNKIRK